MIDRLDFSREYDSFDTGHWNVAQSQPARASAAALHLPDEILVQFAPGAGASHRQAALEAVGGHALEVVRDAGPASGEGQLIRVKLGNGLSVEQGIEILSKRPGVVFAEPNYIFTLDYTAEATSNDPAYTGGTLWGMYGDTTNPANQYGSQAGEAWNAGYIGSSKVVVGVIDSGIDYTHADLYLNIWLNQGEIPSGIRSLLADVDGDTLITFRDLNDSRNASHVSDLNGNGRIDAGDLLQDARWEDGVDGHDVNSLVDDLIGWDFVNNDNDPYDDNEHGTHVAGTIGAIGGNGSGVAGVAWNTQIVALKFLSATGSGSSSNAIKAVDYFTDASKLATNEDFAATNNSWGGGGFAQSLLDAIVRGGREDILFVAAAGNGGYDGRGDNNDSTPHYPSSYSTTSALGWDAVISVASITSSGSLSAFSNYGDLSVDLGAPGSSIYSTVPGGGYASFSGTSMATPHVTGAIALYSSLSTALSTQIRADLLNTAIDIASLTGKTVSDGRLDVYGFILAATGTAPAPTPTPSGPNLVYGTTASETITGTTGDDKIWGVPETGSHSGAGTRDFLVGNGGNDIFVLGDSRGRFYDNSKGKDPGLSDYAHIQDFSAGDKIQLAGNFSNYFQSAGTLDNVSGMRIFHDSNGNGRFDSRDELIGFVAGIEIPLDSSSFVFV